MCRDGHVHDTSAVVREDHEDEEQTVRRGGHDEEIRSHDLRNVIPQEGPPSLRRRVLPTDLILRHTGLTDLNPEFQQFAVDPRRTREGIRR